VEEAVLNEGIFKEYNYDEITELLDNPKLRETFISFLIEEAKNNAPELKAINYSVQATERSEKLFGAGRFLPTVALQAQYNRVFNRSGAGSTIGFPGTTLLDDNYNVALNVSIPIFNQNQNNINKQNAMIQKDQLNINKENFELGISANVRNNVLNLINQLSNIELSGVSEEAAKEALELTQTSYSSGSVNIITLLDAQTNYLNAQLAKTNAMYNFLINALQLERTLGYFFLLNTEDANTQFRQRFLQYQLNKN
jgi:outer membrane protein TolC